jgi:fumarate reductase subunit D
LFELGLASLVVLLLVFPNGRFVPRWTRWVAAFALVQLAWSALFPASFLANPPQVINVPAFVGLWAVCFFAQAYRYRRVSGPIERQQAKWLVFGVAALVALTCAFFLPYALFPKLDQPGVLSLTYDLAGRLLVGTFGFLLIPLSIGVAILRHRLYDIDILINRTLVYGSLTVALVLVYAVSVVVLQQLFRTLTGQGSQLAVVASTLAIAALFSPLRRRVQGFIDRRFYRRKYDAAKTLETFSALLRNETDLDRLGGDLVGVVGETMQPAHVGLWLRPVRSADGQARGERRP